MLQTGLAAAFGFCAALFIVLLFAPAIARRVSALTWQQATRVLPQSSEEIAAGRDHLRGQNAIEMRQLEMKMEAVAEKERQLRIGKLGYEDRISGMTTESEQLKSKVSALEIERARLTNELAGAAENNAFLTTENADRDVRLASMSSDFTNLRSDHARQIAAFGLMQEAHRQLEQRLEAMRTEASALRSKVSTAESELRMARTEAKRHEGDAKLAVRKTAALEGKLERSIKLMAEAEEKLERRDSELKRVKDLGKPQAAVPQISTISAAEPVLQPSQSEAIIAQIKYLRPKLRVAGTANSVEQARLKDEMMDLAGRVTAEAALQNAELMTKISQLRPGSALAGAIIKHNKAAE